MEYANVTHCGTLTGVTFHTKHVTSAVEHVTARLTLTLVPPASVDSILPTTDSVLNATETAQHVTELPVQTAQLAMMDGT